MHTEGGEVSGGLARDSETRLRVFTLKGVNNIILATNFEEVQGGRGVRPE